MQQDFRVTHTFSNILMYAKNILLKLDFFGACKVAVSEREGIWDIRNIPCMKHE